MNWTNVWLILKNTFRSTITGRWLILFALVFFLLVINIPMLFLLSSRELGPSYLNVYVPYLISLAFPFLPLLVLPVGAPNIVEERETGILQFTMSNPISKSEYLTGKISGLLTATTLVLLGAFGIASMVAYGAQLTPYYNILLLILTGGALNCSMVGLAILISLLVKRKATALGLGIFSWFLLTSLSSLGFLTMVTNLNSGPWAILPIVMLNPVEVCSILAASLTGVNLGDLSTTGLLVKHTLGANTTPVLTAIALGWIVIILTLCYVVFLEQDI